MTAPRRLTLLMCTTCGACMRVASATQTGPSNAPNIEVNLVERADDRLVGPYRHTVSYAAELRYQPVEGLRFIAHTESGVTESGQIIVGYPPDCVTLSEFALDVMPSFDHCRATSVASTHMLPCAEPRSLTVAIRCDSPTRRATLHALAWIECHEQDIAVTQLDGLRFHVEGCGERLDLQCDTDTNHLRTEWVCEPRVCHGHNLTASAHSSWSSETSDLSDIRDTGDTDETLSW